MISGEVIFGKIVCTVSQMMIDRGFQLDSGTSPSSKIAQSNVMSGVPIITATNGGGEKSIVFYDVDDRTSIKKVRQLAESFSDCLIVIISLEGPTPFTRREVGSNDQVQFFLSRELMHNPTLHKLVPRHEALLAEQADSIAQTFCMQPDKWMEILVTDPISRYYNWPLGTIVKITRTGLTQDKHIVYRQVVKALPT